MKDMRLQIEVRAANHDKETFGIECPLFMSFMFLLSKFR